MRIGHRSLTIGAGVLALAVGAAPGGVTPSSAPAESPRQPGPLAAYTTHLVATHYLRDRSYITHHYFKPVTEGVLQGLVFRETADGAPLIEVEWAIATEVWQRLPAWQQAFWHPLAPAVDAGRVSAPDLPDAEEAELLRTVRGLWAQTFNLAGLNGELPIGLEGVAMATHLSPEEMRRMMGL